MEHIAVYHFLKVFENSEEKSEEKSEEIFEEKKVYTSDGTNASDLITRVFFNSCNKYKIFSNVIYHILKIINIKMQVKELLPEMYLFLNIANINK